MGEIDNCEIKINKNYKSVKLDKFPISGGMFPDILLKNKDLNNENLKMSEIWIIVNQKNK